MLLKNVQNCVMSNGKSSEYFNLERGTRQGNPLSACQFILILEVLFFQVTSSDNIEGIGIDEFNLRLTAYAGDNYYFIKKLSIVTRFISDISGF